MRISLPTLGRAAGLPGRLGRPGARTPDAGSMGMAGRISLNPSSTALVLGGAALLLVLASTGGQLSRFLLGHGRLKGLVPLFYLGGERNVPTFFSVLLMLFIVLLLAAVALLDGKARVPHARKWAALAGGFLVMAYDEAFQVHERLIGPMRSLLGDGDLGVFYFAWVIPGIALVAALALFFLRFLLQLPAPTKPAFFVAGALYVVGSVGMELLEGRHAEVHGLLNPTSVALATVEESLEMAALVLFIWALLGYIADRHGELQVRFEGGCAASRPVERA
jgi:hypothetical protein